MNKLDNNETTLSLYEKKYKTAQVVSSIIAGFGWFFFGFGVLLVLLAMFFGYPSHFGPVLFSIFPWGFLSMIGLLLLGFGHILRVIIDNASHTHQILNYLIKNQDK